jgi:4a-hydroxytetrahydrobiopterin dehydratase
MQNLNQKMCVPCHGDVPLLTEVEIKELFLQVQEWKIIEHQGIKQLQQVFKFKNFVTAIDFTNKVGELAEAEGHHPALLTEWGKVTVTWWTHSIQGLHENDFIMAAKTDQLLR